MKHLFSFIAFFCFLGTFSQTSFETITIGNFNNPGRVYASDINGDGFIDIVFPSNVDKSIFWIRNEDGNGTFSSTLPITFDVEDFLLEYVAIEDFDNDGDPDISTIIFVSPFDAKLVAYENLDGAGNFGSEILLAETSNNLDMVSGDLDNDGDIELLVTHASGTEGNRLGFFENLGDFNFSEEQVIEDALNMAMTGEAVDTGDIDGDGDLDVVGAYQSGPRVSWYENLGDNNFSGRKVINSGFGVPRDIELTDIDGDGDLDVLYNLSTDNTILWIENLDGLGNFGPDQIVTTEVDSPRIMGTADIDVDGDLDIICASISDDSISWFENQDGAGNFGSKIIIDSNFQGCKSVSIADFDGNGSADIVASGANQIKWYRNSNVLSVASIEASTVSLHPNPVNNILKVASNVGFNSYRVYDIVGQLIMENSLKDDSINMTNLKSGIYFIQLSNLEGKTFYKKVIKQ